SADDDLFGDRRVADPVGAEHLQEVARGRAGLPAAAGGAVDVGLDVLTDDHDALIGLHGLALCGADRAEVAHDGHRSAPISGPGPCSTWVGPNGSVYRSAKARDGSGKGLASVKDTDSSTSARTSASRASSCSSVAWPCSVSQRRKSTIG